MVWLCAQSRERGESAMKVVVDFEICQSHGLCMQAAPEVFELRDDGFLYILDENPAEGLRKRRDQDRRLIGVRCERARAGQG
jgi:ferredoxin